MTESDPEFEAEYQAELKRIKLQKARDKAKKDARRAEGAGRKERLRKVTEKARQTLGKVLRWVVGLVVVWLILYVISDFA